MPAHQGRKGSFREWRMRKVREGCHEYIYAQLLQNIPLHKDSDPSARRTLSVWSSVTRGDSGGQKYLRKKWPASQWFGRVAPGIPVFDRPRGFHEPQDYVALEVTASLAADWGQNCGAIHRSGRAVNKLWQVPSRTVPCPGRCTVPCKMSSGLSGCRSNVYMHLQYNMVICFGNKNRPARRFFRYFRHPNCHKN